MTVAPTLPREPVVRTLRARPEDLSLDLAATAVIVVDMQNAYLSKGGYIDLAGFSHEGAEASVKATAPVLQAARAAGVTIVYLQNGWDAGYREAGGALSPNQYKSNALKLIRKRPELNGTLLAKGGWDYALREEIAPKEGDLVVPKPRYSGFYNTALDSILRSRGIRNLIFVGVATNVCVETTIRDAFALEYFAVLVKDCCHHAGPPMVQEATVYNVETFFGWSATSEDLRETLAINTPAS
ncbi:isochorismatase family protein [Acuticoccus mangrovi]|uniref:Isochorismatase family protein n=1 Tax=Acuticoccus mangrovi TaxID=2796142 RepID=A0A934IQC8_9HYPH|nr:isochorismatase family protein [Acuticoccus mangrovi]MBJ3776766.1 isochorismatase family protein [Acuticoccus mangrovi]